MLGVKEAIGVVSRGRDLVEALLLICGIWLLLRQIPDFATSLLLVVGGNGEGAHDAGPSVFAFHAVRVVTSILMGSLLVAIRKPMARWLFPKEPEYAFAEGALVSVGAAVISVFFVMSGLVTLGDYYTQRPRGFNEPYLIVSGLVSVGLGLLLFVGAPWIARLWGFITRVGRPDA